MTAQRQTALALMAILGLFIALTAASLVRTYERELSSGLLTSGEIPALKAELAQSPHDEALKEKIRKEDQRIRTDYFSSRRRFNWSAWVLLVASAAWLASARRFVAGAPKRLPSVLEPGFAARRRAELSLERRNAVWTAGSLGGALFLWMLWYGLFRQPPIPAPGETGPGGTATANPAPTNQGPTSTAPLLGERGRGEGPPPNTAWPGFRGPGNLGLAADGAWPTSWTLAADGSPGTNVLWKADLPVEGKSSPAVWGDRIFITGGGKTEQRVVCLAIADGSVLWNALVQVPADTTSASAHLDVSEDTGFAAPSPAADGTRVYALFANGVLAAYDFDGKPAWQHELGVPESTYGMASSPLLAGKLLIVQYDQGSDPDAGKSELLAFDAATGKSVWSAQRQVPNSWSSPALIAVAGKPQIVTCAAPWVIAYDPATGRDLWKTDPLSGDVAPSPAFADGVVYVTNTGAKTLALRPPATGSKPEELWSSDEALPDTSSPVCDGKHLVISGAGGNLTCSDPASGHQLWEHSLPANATSSPIVAGGFVYLCLDDGSTVVIKPGDTYQEIARNDLGEPLYATPAFVKDKIVIRGKSHLFCIGAREAGSKP